jgi:hypothetical protein
MFDKTQEKALRWSITENYLPIIRRAVFTILATEVYSAMGHLSGGADMNEKKVSDHVFNEMKTDQFTKHLLNKLVLIQRDDKNTLLEETMNQYGLVFIGEEREFYIRELGIIYDHIIEGATKLVMRKDFKSVMVLAKG